MIRLPPDVSAPIEEGQTVVVPSRQRSEAVRLAYAAGALARRLTVWPTPDVLPLEAWKAREIERRVASGERLPRLVTAAEEWFLWRQTATELTRDLGLVAGGPLADSLRRAVQLAQEFHIDIARLRDAHGSETRLLVQAWELVGERLRALGAANAAELATQLPCLGGSRPLLAAGFVQRTPALDALMASRVAQGCACTLRNPPDPPSSQRTRAVLASDTADELERIADWCREQLAQRSDARLLVILPGLPEARERLVTLIRQSIDPQRYIAGDLARADANTLVAVEGGLPLSRAPLVAHALRSLEWLTGGLEYEAFSSWLCSPYWAIPDAARARLDLWLRERAPLEMSPRGLLTALQSAPSALDDASKPLAAQVTNALSALGGGRASPRQWSERFDAVLAALQWPGARVLDSNEEQTRARFKELLDDFGQLASIAAVLSREEAVTGLGELAARTAFLPASGDALVTVCPQFVDPVVQYDGLWVAGLHADAWPQPVRSDPFLPVDRQIAAGIPAATSEGRAAEAQALLAAWRSSTPDLVLSAPLRSEDVQLSASPLLQPYIERGVANDGSRSFWLPLRLRREGMTHLIEDRVGTTWDIARAVPSGTRSIELQNLCPFRAYAELRLGSAEMDGPEPGVAADVRGRLLHKALEKLWRVLGGSAGLQARSDDALDALIAESVEQAAEETMGPATQGGRPAPDRRECRRAERLIRKLCDLERKRTPFTVRDTELDCNVQLAGAQLRIRIDRVDVLESGGLAILDYKSGRPVPGDWYSERPSHPQLLAYQAALGNDTAAMATVSITAREIRFDGVAADANLLPKVRAVEAVPGQDSASAWAHWQREWRARIDKLAADFVAGRAAVDPRPRACEYCHAVSICRISDKSATAVEQNIDE